MNIPGKMRVVVQSAHGVRDKLDCREDWPGPGPGGAPVRISVYTYTTAGNPTARSGPQPGETEVINVASAGNRIGSNPAVPPGSLQRPVGLIEQDAQKPLLAPAFPLRELGLGTLLQKNHLASIVLEAR